MVTISTIPARPEQEFLVAVAARGCEAYEQALIKKGKFTRDEQMSGRTKIEIAEAHLKCGIRLFFQDADPVCVYHLVNAAREIVTTLCDKEGKSSILNRVAKGYRDTYKHLIESVSGICELPKTR
jgi:hypothetical protein